MESLESLEEPSPGGPDVPWLDAEQLNAWQGLMGMIMTLPFALDAQLKRDAGLNLFEYHVLASLSEAPQSTQLMSQLAAQLRGSLSRLSHAVSRLERAGWVERRSCGGAGRRTEVTLTEHGRNKVLESAPGHVREARRLVVDALDSATLQALGEASMQVVAATDPSITELIAQVRDYENVVPVLNNDGV